MHRVRGPEFGKLFDLSAVRRSVPFSLCRPRHHRGDRSQSLLYEGVSVGAERIDTKTSLAPSVLVDFLPWIGLNRGPALVVAHPASDLLGDLYVITPKTEFLSCRARHHFFHQIEYVQWITSAEAARDPFETST
jgi:hypothetical protein